MNKSKSTIQWQGSQRASFLASLHIELNFAIVQSD